MLVTCTPGHSCDSTMHTGISERKCIKGSAWSDLGEGGTDLARHFSRFKCGLIHGVIRRVSVGACTLGVGSVSTTSTFVGVGTAAVAIEGGDAGARGSARADQAGHTG